jgi:hypothetical protein
MRSFAAFLDSSSNTDRSTSGGSTVYEDAVMSLSESSVSADEASPPDIDCESPPHPLSELQLQLQRQVRWQAQHGPPAVIRSNSNAINSNSGRPWQWEHEDDSKEELRIVGTAPAALRPPAQPDNNGSDNLSSDDSSSSSNNGQLQQHENGFPRSPPRPYSIKTASAPPAGSFPTSADIYNGDYAVYDSRLPALVEDMPTIYEEDKEGLLANQQQQQQQQESTDSADSTLQSKRSTSSSPRSGRGGSRSSSRYRSGGTTREPCWQNPRLLWILIGLLFIGLGGTLLSGILWRQDDDDEARGITVTDAPVPTRGPSKCCNRLDSS